MEKKKKNKEQGCKVIWLKLYHNKHKNLERIRGMMIGGGTQVT